MKLRRVWKPKSDSTDTLINLIDCRKNIAGKVFVAVVSAIGIFLYVHKVDRQDKFPLSVLSPTYWNLPDGRSGNDHEYESAPTLLRAEQEYQRNIQRRNNTPAYQVCIVNKTSCYWRALRDIFLYPMYPCPYPMGLGSVGEGGKWICNIPGQIKNGTAIVYSIGSKGETDFEEDMYRNFNTKVYTFDPTLPLHKEQLVKQIDFIDFYKIGLTGEVDVVAAAAKFSKMVPGARLMHIADVMKMLNHTYVDVFKIDCEGCEVEFVESLLRTFNRDNPPFGQVLMEVHSLHSISVTVPMLTGMEKLGYQLFHVEQNHWNARCYELAYIHDSLFR